ncbi:MAG: pantoate--beta-alanine ligase [Paracoccaceae bacterium]
MDLCRDIAGFRAARARMEDVGLVTTMGALHAGHMALIAAAKAAHPHVVATIFVNPTQFGDPADLAAYPRSEATDLAMLRDAGVDAVLIPDAAEIYPPGDVTVVKTVGLADAYHGAVRPGHFRGVATVVCKLLNIAQPNAAYFGEKDYQQLAVIRRMVRDLHLPVRIEGVRTVREADGLAMSSRNARLGAQDRAAAPAIHAALRAGRAVAGRGAAAVEAAIRDSLAREPRVTLRGLDIVDPETFAPTEAGPMGVMISAQLGDVLLLDQMEM